MSKSNSGIVTPNIKKCIDEMLLVFDDNDKDGAHDIVVDVILNYLVKSNRTKLMLMVKLRARKVVPKVMDKFDCAALLHESGIKKWQVEKDSTMPETIYGYPTSWFARKLPACIRC
jgi:hypothetical protein